MTWQWAQVVAASELAYTPGQWRDMTIEERTALITELNRVRR